MTEKLTHNTGAEYIEVQLPFLLEMLRTDPTATWQECLKTMKYQEVVDLIAYEAEEFAKNHPLLNQD